MEEIPADLATTSPEEASKRDRAIAKMALDRLGLSIPQLIQCARGDSPPRLSQSIDFNSVMLFARLRVLEHERDKTESRYYPEIPRGKVDNEIQAITGYLASSRATYTDNDPDILKRFHPPGSRANKLGSNGLDHSSRGQKPKAAKSGRKPSALREAVEYLYDKFKEEKTELLEAGSVGSFIEEMKAIRKAAKDEFISCRIKEVKKTTGKWQITTEEQIIQVSNSREISDRSRRYVQNDVSKILTGLRKKEVLTPQDSHS